MMALMSHGFSTGSTTASMRPVTSNNSLWQSLQPRVRFEARAMAKY